MKPGVYRFRTIEEADKWNFIERLKEGMAPDELDRFEFMRLRVKAYSPGVYRFKTIKEKREDEFKRVMEAWRNERVH